MPYDGSEMLLEAANRHGIHLSILVAETGLWAHPDVHARILGTTRSAARHPNVRRVRVGDGEERGQVVNGVRLDDNTYANRAIKEAIGLPRSEVTGFETCHIWPKTCYDVRYHTAIANLVLLPRALAGLSDHDREIQAALQYRAYELYAWHPEGMPVPHRPEFYPSTWREPEPAPELTRRCIIEPAVPQPTEVRERVVGATQRDTMRALYRKYGGDRENTVAEYAAAERRGDIRRKRNASGLASIEYARRLFADGEKKGWLGA
jgi:hypothetical protein